MPPEDFTPSLPLLSLTFVFARILFFAFPHTPSGPGNSLQLNLCMCY